jgi:valyl-tRNA synthetase
MFSPFIPHVTESIYQSFYKYQKSINLESWPQASKECSPNQNINVENLFEIISLVRGQKTKDGKNLATPIDTLTIFGVSDLNDFTQNLKDVTRTQNIIFNQSDEISIKIDYSS